MKKQQRGIALLEAMIATIILAIGLIGTIGMQARAQSAMAQADMRAEATIASERLIGMMANDQGADQANLKLYIKTEGGAAPAVMATWFNDTAEQIPGALVAVAVTEESPGLSRIDVTIKWTRRAGDKQDQHLVTSYIAAS